MGIRKAQNNDRSEFSVQWKGFVAVYGEPFSNTLLHRAYKMFEIEYAHKDLRGFADHRKFRPAKLNDELRSELAIINPPTHDALNIIYIEVKKDISHVALVHFKTKEQAMVIYHGDASRRNKPLDDYITRLLLSLHGNVPGPLRAGYCHGYSIQGDLWSCAPRAIFACVAVMHKKDPADYDVNLKAVFRFMKMAIEDNGKKLEDYTLKQVWREISKKKKKLSQKTINFEYIKK